MKREYDFSKMKTRKNRFARVLTKPVTIRLANDVIDHFKALAKKTGLPYRSVISHYLHYCVATGRAPSSKRWPRKDQ